MSVTVLWAQAVLRKLGVRVECIPGGHFRVFWPARTTIVDALDLIDIACAVAGTGPKGPATAASVCRAA